MKKRKFFTDSPPHGHAVTRHREHISIDSLKGYGRADIHTHSSASDAVVTPEEIVDYVENNTNLDVIAITDHDQIKGAIRAREYAIEKGCRLRVIVGEEVSTLKGHLLGLFMKKRIKRYTGLIDTVKAIHGQGGLAIVPHPLSWLTTSVGEQAFRSVLKSRDKDVYFDAVEMINPAIAGKVTDERAQHLNKTLWNLPVTGGSDSHSLDGIGTAFTLFPGKTEDDLRRAILEGTTLYGGKYWNFKEHWELFTKKFKKFKIF